MSTIRLMNDGTRTEIVTDAELAAAKASAAQAAAGQSAVVTASIAISVTAACNQCHVNVAVNAIAPEAHCPECNQHIALDWSLWRDVLSAAVIDGPVAAPNEDHLEALNGGAKTTLIRNYVRKDAACARCKAALPLPRALQGADHGFCICVNCGDKVSLRKAPPELAQLNGLTHIIGEDIAALAGTTAPRARLFYLWHERAAHALKATSNQFDWKYLEDAVCDRNGNMYFVNGGQKYEWDSDAKTGVGLWSVDALFKPRWQRGPVTTGEDYLEGPELSVTPSGFMILRAKNRHHAYVLSCADGSTATNLGGREPPGATAHGFDLKDCDALTCDVDGTILGGIHKRLLRWTYDGRPLETWPVTGLFGRHHTMQPLYQMSESEERKEIAASEEYPPGPKEVGNHPYELPVEYGELHVGFDGNLIYREGDDIAKLDRQGKVLFRASLPPDLSHNGRLQSDAHGNTYVLCEGKQSVRMIMRISPLGQVDWAVDGSRAGTPMWDGEHLVVLPQGTMYVFDNDGSARAFNADGSLRFASPKAREADQEAVKRREAESR